jgi:cytidylate kinase
MAWFFAPDTFKVYVTVDPAVAARRVGIDPRPGEPASEVEIYEELEQRSKVEQARFIKFYGEGADYYNWNNFNLIVDSTSRTAAEVAEVIWNAFEAYQADPVANRHVEAL